MPNVFATPDDCNSVLGKKMQERRADRPSEWLMDDFIRDVEKLDTALMAAISFINCHVADHDITPEMAERYFEYQSALGALVR